MQDPSPGKAPAAPASGRQVGVQTALVLALVADEELRVLDAGETEVTVETPDALPDTVSLTLAVFDLPRWDYAQFRFDDCRVVERRPQPHSEICRLALGQGQRRSPGDTSYAACLEQLKEMWRGNPHRDGRAPCGVSGVRSYADVESRRSYATYAEQRRAWFAERPAADAPPRFAALASRVEHAFAVCTPAGYDALTDHGCRGAVSRALAELALDEHPLLQSSADAADVFTRLYLGNAFCPHLSPTPARFEKLLAAASDEGFAITVTMPQLMQHTVEPTAALLAQLEVHAGRGDVELVVNDWGMLALVREHAPSFEPTLGRLLNKRKKDPRAPWYWGGTRHERDLEQNNLGAPWYRDFLAEHGIARYELEAGPMRAHVPSAGCSLHYPFYYTNASAFCMLYAELTEFYSGRQRLVKSCPRYCADFCYLYPDHLRLVGKGNAVFGFDAEILVDAGSLERYVEAGVDRLVFTPDC